MVTIGSFTVQIWAVLCKLLNRTVKSHIAPILVGDGNISRSGKFNNQICGAYVFLCRSKQERIHISWSVALTSSALNLQRQHLRLHVCPCRPTLIKGWLINTLASLRAWPQSKRLPCTAEVLVKLLIQMSYFQLGISNLSDGWSRLRAEQAKPKVHRVERGASTT